MIEQMTSPIPSYSALWHSGKCTVCGGTDLKKVLEMKDVPSQDGVVLPTKHAALHAPRGNIDFRFCKSCGYLGNSQYDAKKVKFHGYDISLEFSGVYKDFVAWLVQRLVDKYDIRKKTVLEVACGKGYFLRELCRYGNNKGIGFDPSYEPASSKEEVDVQFVTEYYSESHADYHVDLLCCRQMVDLIDAPREFVMGIRSALVRNPDVVAYFEVPNAAATWQKFVPWNVVYEHCSWFMEKPLASFFESCGFEVLDVYPCHQGEYLGIEVRMGNNRAISTKMSDDEIAAFEKHLARAEEELSRSILDWQGTLRSLQSDGKRVVAWGAGARAIGFLNALRVGDQIQYVADINPRRMGKFLPGSGQEVVPPEFLKAYSPDVIIITNPTYENEIKKQARELGLAGEFLVL